MIQLAKTKLTLIALVIASLFLCASITNAQTASNTQDQNDSSTATDAVLEPSFKDYKGVRIGMISNEVVEKLGTPEVGDTNEQVFLISDFEMVQVVYKNGKVSAISITYSAEHPNAPSALAVLGEDVAADADGRIYKLVRYPDLGYWLAYSRTAGATPVVSVTMKKI